MKTSELTNVTIYSSYRATKRANHINCLWSDATDCDWYFMNLELNAPQVLLHFQMIVFFPLKLYLV